MNIIRRLHIHFTASMIIKIFFLHVQRATIKYIYTATKKKNRDELLDVALLKYKKIKMCSSGKL